MAMADNTPQLRARVLPYTRPYSNTNTNTAPWSLETLTLALVLALLQHGVL